MEDPYKKLLQCASLIQSDILRMLKDRYNHTGGEVLMVIHLSGYHEIELRYSKFSYLPKASSEEHEREEYKIWREAWLRIGDYDSYSDFLAGVCKRFDRSLPKKVQKAAG